MKKILSTLALTLALLLLMTSCVREALWESATYSLDTSVGEGAKTVFVEIEAGDKKVTLTVKTDKQTLGEALFELGIINDASFFDTANGIKADWYKDSAYWAFYKGNDYMMHGVGDEIISGGEHYRLAYTR
ncbi:MAG: hypothetical protein J6Q85_05880 [Clostridia bacterium]|nr:hypothetical protein [Clostridia bacterium]